LTLTPLDVISAPSTYIPQVEYGGSWSPDEYGTLHNVRDITNPQIEHLKLGPEVFGMVEETEEESQSEGHEMKG